MNYDLANLVLGAYAADLLNGIVPFFFRHVSCLYASLWFMTDLWNRTWPFYVFDNPPSFVGL